LLQAAMRLFRIWKGLVSRGGCESSFFRLYHDIFFFYYTVILFVRRQYS